MLRQPEYIDTIFGVVRIYLRELLNTYSSELEFEGAIVPKVVFIDSDRNNLELNKTARKEAHEIIKGTEYMDQGSTLKVRLSLMFPLDRYQKPKDLVAAEISDQKGAKKQQVVKPAQAPTKNSLKDSKEAIVAPD